MTAVIRCAAAVCNLIQGQNCMHFRSKPLHCSTVKQMKIKKERSTVLGGGGGGGALRLKKVRFC